METKTFEQWIQGCGYNMDDIKPHELQVVNAARAAWCYRQFEIDALRRYINRFTSTLDDLRAFGSEPVPYVPEGK